MTFRGASSYKRTPQVSPVPPTPSVILGNHVAPINKDGELADLYLHEYILDTLKAYSEGKLKTSRTGNTIFTARTLEGLISS